MIEINKIYQGDCIEIMHQWPDKCIDAIITDPVWPDCSVPLAGYEDAYGLFAKAAIEFTRLTDTLIVQLGCDSDVRFMSSIPKELPFLRVMWLRYARPSYKGRLLYSGDVAYLFGKPRIPDGKFLLPGESPANQITDTDSKKERYGHPCPRALIHVNWLVNNFTREGDIILDPFCGSGTTLVAAARAARKWIGIEIEPKYVAIAEGRVNAEMAQISLL